MTYADYGYYFGTYMGAVSEKDFPRLVVRASSFLDYYTQNQAKDNADKDEVFGRHPVSRPFNLTHRGLLDSLRPFDPYLIVFSGLHQPKTIRN